MSSKNPEKSLQGSESHLFWHEHGKGNKTQAAQAIDEDEEDVLFFNPVALQRTVSSSKRTSVQRSVTVFHRASF